MDGGEPLGALAKRRRMDEYRQLRFLLDLAEELGVAIRRAPAASSDGANSAESHPGGALVKLMGRDILFLDPSASVSDRIAVAASALTGRDELEERFLPPEIRRRIERAGPAG